MNMVPFQKRVDAMSDAELRDWGGHTCIRESAGDLRAVSIEDLHLRMVVVATCRHRFPFEIDVRALDEARGRLVTERQYREPWRCPPGLAPRPPRGP